MTIVRLALLFLCLTLCSIGTGCESGDSSKPESAAQTPAVTAAAAEKADQLGPDQSGPIQAAPLADEAYIEIAHRLTDHLAQGDYETALPWFSEAMKKEITTAGWQRVWSQVRRRAGNFEKIGASVIGREKAGDREYVVVKHGLLFNRLNHIQSTRFNLDGQVIGLSVFPGEIKIDSDGQARYKSTENLAWPISDQGEPLRILKTDDDYIKAARQFTNDFASGNYEAIIATLNRSWAPPFKNPAGWERFWNHLIEWAGDFQGIGASVVRSAYQGESEYVIVNHDLLFSNMNLIQSMVFNSKGRVAGMYVSQGQINVDDQGQAQYEAPPSPPAVPVNAPEGVLETEVSIDSLPGFPIVGTLTRPTGPIKALVIMVHGSGPNDRDETFIANKPFRDIAHGLALKGLASLRYDKMTKVHAEYILFHPNYEHFTIDDEAVNDAVTAFQWCQWQEEFQGKKIFLLGHSLGGFLLSRINAQGAEVAGYVLLGAPTRSLLEILYEQNDQYYDDFLASERLDELENGYEQNEVEMDKARALRKTEDEKKIQEETVFGFTGWYAKHLDAIKPIDLHLIDRKPILVLHGAKDRQVLLKDYQAW